MPGNLAPEMLGVIQEHRLGRPICIDYVSVYITQPCLSFQIYQCFSISGNADIGKLPHLATVGIEFK